MISEKVFSILQYLLFISLIPLILSQSIDLTLNKTETGAMYQDNSYNYYKLKLPETIENNKLILVFTVKESHKGFQEGEELFSDPDIHISKRNFPKSKDDSQWYSQKYGNDILTIPADEVRGGEEFYISMFCEFKCRYELNSYLAEEVEIEIGKINTATLSSMSSLSYYINIGNENFEELNLIATSPNLQNFKIFMSNTSPSSQNTFKIIPSWTGGYTISVERYTNEYCTNCKYHILLQSMEDNDVNVQFYAYFQDTVTTVLPGSVIYDVVKKDKKRCYSYQIKAFNNNYNNDKEKIMIQTSFFSGSGLIYISGAKKQLDKNINELTQISLNLNTYAIQGEKILMLTMSDIDKINSQYNSYDLEDKSLLYFCIYGKETSSFILNVYPLSEASKLQKYNYISPGTELTGYLNGNDVTRYRILDFNKNKNSNITVTFTNFKGQSNLYTNFCYEKCNFNNELLKNKIEQNEILYPQESLLNTFTLKIIPEKNKCYQTDNTKNKCKILLIVKCNENPDNFCGFKMLVSISENPTMMSPKKTFYNIIPKGKTDFYELIVDDVNTPSVVIVLTSVTGDAELAVYRKENINDFGTDTKDMKLVGVSMNNDYIPDVVRITPNKINKDNIAGRYFIKITGKCFSSYNLYYYTTRNKAIEKQVSVEDITASLKEGHIIRDFFPNDIDYKVYIYTPETEEKKDIKFILTRINVEFSFKIFDDFQKIKVENNLYDNDNYFDEKIKGYLWASDQNNEVTISINDKNYSSKKSYFIVVYKNKKTVRDEEINNDLTKKSMMMYYIGVTKMGIPFTLYEVIEHSETLNDKYFYQNYFYLHNDISQPFHLDINVLSGEVDIFVNTNPIPFENTTLENSQIPSVQNSISAKLGVNTYAAIELNSVYFHNFCSQNNNYNIINNYNYNPHNQNPCQLYIYVVQSKSSKKYQRDSQYIISAKSSSKAGKIFLSGQIISGEILPNKTEHFIIEEVKKRKGSTINVKFTEGYGELYVRIPKYIESGQNMTFPDEKNYDFKGRNAYMGQTVTLPSKVFDRIDSLSLKLQILISIVGSSFYSLNDKTVKFTISYSSEPKRLNQNRPYTSFISAGEYHFYTLYFNDKTRNIYIALSNMNGDADLYLNYGIDKQPSPNDHDWYSVNMGHEYIDISEDNEFYKKNKLKSMAGYYSLLVVGFTETTYTLFISSHDDNIFPLSDNSPISCKCESKGDKCFYRYDNVFKSSSEESDLYKSNEIIFTSQYIYGNGRMYANLLKDQDISGERGKKFQDYFPTEKLYHFSNREYGKRNYMKVKINEDQYSKDSLILMTFICEEKTDVEITAASLSLRGLYNYLDRDRENIFYLKFNESQGISNQKESTFTFFSYKEEDVIYEIKAYTGMAKIKVFTNETRYNATLHKLLFDYEHISEFTIRSDDSYKFDSYKVFTDNYINSIHGQRVKGKRIYFSVTPLTDFGFYLQILYDREWINVPINKDKTYLIKNDNLDGYFDIYQDFQSVEMSVSLNDFAQKIATVYIKLIVREKDSKSIGPGNTENRLYHYEIPGKYNNDYTAKTNKYLGTMNININNIPIPKSPEKQFVRALFKIVIEKDYSTPYSPRDALSQQQLNNNININANTQKDTYIRIVVTPGVNNFKRVDVPPLNYYFSNTTLISQSTNYNLNNNNIYNGNKEIKIYSLDKINEKDDKMIIQINSCSGDYDIKLSKKIVTYDDNSDDLPYEIVGGLQGRKTYIINNLRNKHVYLSVKSAQNEYDCNMGKEIDRNNNTCSNDLSYLLYYHTTSSHKLYSENNIYEMFYRVDSRNHFYLIIPRIGGMDKEFLEYNLIWTRNETYAKNMESICYLSQMFNKENEIDNTTVFIEKNVELNNRNEIYISKIYLSSQPLYLNILVRNKKNNELIAFKPLIVVVNKTILSILFYFIIIGGLIIFFYYFYDTIRNKIVDFYWSGFSISALFGIKKEGVKYTNLSNNYY